MNSFVVIRTPEAAARIGRSSMTTERGLSERPSAVGMLPPRRPTYEQVNTLNAMREM